MAGGCVDYIKSSQAGGVGTAAHRASTAARWWLRGHQTHPPVQRVRYSAPPSTSITHPRARPRLLGLWGASRPMPARKGAPRRFRAAAGARGTTLRTSPSRVHNWREGRPGQGPVLALFRRRDQIIVDTGWAVNSGPHIPLGLYRLSKSPRREDGTSECPLLMMKPKTLCAACRRVTGSPLGNTSCRWSLFHNPCARQALWATYPTSKGPFAAEPSRLTTFPAVATVATKSASSAISEAFGPPLPTVSPLQPADNTRHPSDSSEHSVVTRPFQLCGFWAVAGVGVGGPRPWV